MLEQDNVHDVPRRLGGLLVSPLSIRVRVTRTMLRMKLTPPLGFDALVFILIGSLSAIFWFSLALVLG